MKKIITMIVLLIILLGSFSYADQKTAGTYEKARVLEVTNEDATQGNMKMTRQKVKILLLSGEDEGKEFQIENVVQSTTPFAIKVKSGDKVLVYHVTQGITKGQYHISDYYRQDKLYYLLAIFVIALLAVGRWHGLKSIVTLSATVGIIFFVFIPLVMKGFSPLLLATACSLVITAVTILVIAGFTDKTKAAIWGTLCGVVIAGILAMIVGKLARVTGLSTDEAMMMAYLPLSVKISPEGILYAGIIFGALGAIMDVAMSISSSIEEIHRSNPLLSKKELYKAGMNVGRDVMGTMTNTLILAYIGTAIPLILIFFSYSHQMLKFINLDMIITEAVRAVAGSTGLILSIPITALLAVTFKSKD